MLAQILNQQLVRDQLPSLAEALRGLAKEPERIPQELGDLSPADLEEACRLIVEAAEAPATIEDDPGVDVARRGEIPPIEDYAYIPRDATVSIVQSVLERGVRELFPERIPPLPAKTQGRRRAAEPVPVTDEFIDGQALQVVRESGRTRRVGGPFQIPTDIRWASAWIAQGIRLWKHRHPFVDKPQGRQIADNARLLLVGDWATGIPRARQVSNWMRTVIEDGLGHGLEQHVIHLGDVYYSGFGYEYRNRFLPNWPVWPGEDQAISSWSLIGNHDMYAGGWGYWNDLLSDPRFSGHAGCSYFVLENAHWRVFGLDSGWEKEHGSLPGQQAKWLDEGLDTPKRTLLLSHHQLVSSYKDGSEKLRDRVLPMLKRHPVDAWFWGHEHRCMTFRGTDHVRYPRCLGHGGVPVYQWHDLADAVPPPGDYEYRDVSPGLLGLEPWAVFGFAVIDLDGPNAHVRYINEFGTTHHTESLMP